MSETKPQWGWWASYECGCVSETVTEKEALLGRVCPTHGALQTHVYGTEPPPTAESEPAPCCESELPEECGCRFMGQGVGERVEAIMGDGCSSFHPPGGEALREVVERLEAAIRRYAVNLDLLQCALSAIHDLRTERDGARGGIDRLVTENFSYTTRIGEFEADRDGLRKQNERLKRALREYGRPENWRMNALCGPIWKPDHTRVGVPAWEDPTHIANLALGRQAGAETT